MMIAVDGHEWPIPNLSQGEAAGESVNPRRFLLKFSVRYFFYFKRSREKPRYSDPRTMNYISQKAKYAVKVLIALAKEDGTALFHNNELAERERIPPKFLEIILRELRNAGVLHSRRGKGGGYSLAQHPSSITLGQVLRLIDGPQAPLPCLSRMSYRKCDECIDEQTCGIRLSMQIIYDATSRLLDSTTLTDIIRRADVAKASKSALSFDI
jgi:Rrf2 family protein